MSPKSSNILGILGERGQTTLSPPDLIVFLAPKGISLAYRHFNMEMVVHQLREKLVDFNFAHAQKVESL